MPPAVAASQSPAAVPPTTRPKLAKTAPAMANASAPNPTRNPTESIIGEL